ncbi:glycosyltransferase family 4 protein [Glacieibacterium sp.]|uniref:glycosyltransferase family 4 protein n=1 Tax=Glacieibacterium sp. TaxID=2860237 RepID=UPI003B00578B
MTGAAFAGSPRSVVLVLSSLGAGGAERVIALLANHFAAGGARVTVIAFDRESDPVFHTFDPAVELVRLAIPPQRNGRLGAMGRTARRISLLRRTLRNLAPEIIISFLIKINVTVLLASAGLGIPVVVSERNHPGRGNGNALWSFGRRVAYRRAAAVVLQTEASRAALPGPIGRRGIVIGNPISCWPRTDEAASGTKILAAVGRLDPQKGFDLLLPAFAAVADRLPDWRLVIWGEGPSRPALEAQRKSLGLDNRVVMPGTSTTPGGWVATASAFVLSSRYEGFGNAVVEAMMSGLPVVAFDCEYGIRILIRDNVDGLLVPPESVDDLASGIATLLLDSDLRRRLGSEAAISAQRFTPPIILEKWDKLLRDVLRA